MFKINEVREKLARDELLVGANVLFDDASISELYGFSGCDYVWIDMEHASFTCKDVERHIIAAHAGGAAAFVRLPWNDMVVAKQVLDMGPDGIIMPLIRSAQEAEDAVRFCAYPPRGVRGWNPIRASKYGCLDSDWYIKNIDSLTWKILMIEHIDAVNDLENILAIPEIDAIMIGPSDLTGSMGCMLQTNTALFWETIDRITAIAKQAGKVIGVAIPANSPPEVVEKWIQKGVRMFSVGQDINFLSAAVKANVSAAKDVFAKMK